MKLKLNRSLKSRLVQSLTLMLFDLSDGTIDVPEKVIFALRTLADEIETQNVQS